MPDPTLLASSLGGRLTGGQRGPELQKHTAAFLELETGGLVPPLRGEGAGEGAGGRRGTHESLGLDLDSGGPAGLRATGAGAGPPREASTAEKADAGATPRPSRGRPSGGIRGPGGHGILTPRDPDTGTSLEMPWPTVRAEGFPGSSAPTQPGEPGNLQRRWRCHGPQLKGGDVGLRGPAEGLGGSHEASFGGGVEGHDVSIFQKCPWGLSKHAGSEGAGGRGAQKAVGEDTWGWLLPLLLVLPVFWPLSSL